LPAEVFADGGPEDFQVALTGSEGLYELTATERSTAILGFVPVDGALVADGQDETKLTIEILDRFGNLKKDDNSTHVQLAVTPETKMGHVSDLIVREGVGVFSLQSITSGPIEVTASAEGLAPIKAVILARPALMLEKGEDASTPFVDVRLIAASGMAGVTGIQARVAYDPIQLVFEAFIPEDLMAGARQLLVYAVNGAVEINVAHFDGTIQRDGGLVGHLRFRLLGNLDLADDLVLLEGHYGGEAGIQPFGIGPDTGRLRLGSNGHRARQAFRLSFGASAGEERYQVRYDANLDGRIDFQDFLAWLSQQQD
jgi:hypothetical protein